MGAPTAHLIEDTESVGPRRGCDHRAEGDHTLLPTQDPQSLGRSAPFCSILAPFRDSLFEKYRHLSAYLGICDG